MHGIDVTSTNMKHSAGRLLETARVRTECQAPRVAALPLWGANIKLPDVTEATSRDTIPHDFACHRSHICTLNAVPDTGDFLLRVGTEAVLLIQNRAVVAPAVVRGWWCCCWNQYVMSIVSRIARIISNSIYSHRRARLNSH